MACHDKPPRRNSPGPTRALIPGRRKAAGTYTACIAVRITYLPTYLAHTTLIARR